MRANRFNLADTMGRINNLFTYLKHENLLVNRNIRD